MGQIVGRGWGLGLALALMGGAAAAGPVQAQIVVGGDQTECRCVDADGNRIENCTCIRTGDFPLRSYTLSSLGLDRRSQIGVFIDMEQDDGELRGVRVTEVIEESPAEEAGIRVGDVIVEIGGMSVLEELDDELEIELDVDMSLATQRFVEIVGDLEPEEEVEVVVLRNGGRVTVEVRPEASSGTFTLRGLDGEGLVTLRGNMLFDEAERREVEASLREARDELRAFNFRFQERDQQQVQELAERRLEESLRMHELAEARRDELRGLEIELREMQQGRAGEMRALEEQLARGRLFGTTSDPCMEMYRDGGSRIMVLAGDGCIDGLRLADMNEGLAAYFGTDTGVLVTEVSETSSLGLEAGDVVLRVGDRTVEDADDLRRILRSYDTDESVSFRVRREGREIQLSGMRRGG